MAQDNDRLPVNTNLNSMSINFGEFDSCTVSAVQGDLHRLTTFGSGSVVQTSRSDLKSKPSKLKRQGVRQMFNAGHSRYNISDETGIPYSTVCGYIR